MKTRSTRLAPPVAAFMFVIVAGWALTFFFGEWWWLAGSIPLALIAGDLAEAMFQPPELASPKDKRTTRKGP